MTPRGLARPLIRGLLAGAAGTAAMSTSEWLHSLAHQRWRPDVPGPIDYDTSDHVVVAAAKVVPFPIRSDAQARLLFHLTHNGYGSLFGLVSEALAATGLSPRGQVTVFFLSTEALAMTLFPVLGETPPPWRWRRELLIASLVQHAVYSLTAVGVRQRLAETALR